MTTPTDFPDTNLVLTAPQGMDNCGELHVQCHGDGMLSCWKMGWRERLSALIFGRIWLNLYTREHPPVWVAVQRDIRNEGPRK